MKALASYIMRGPMQAAMVVALTSALSLIASPVNLFTAGAVALVTLRNGWRSGLLVMAGGVAAAAAMGFVATQSTPMMTGFVIAVAAVVVPVWLLSVVLRATISLGLTVALATVGGAVLVLTIYAVTGDPQETWRTILDDAFAANAVALGATTEDTQTIVETFSRLITGVLAAALVTSTIVGLFLGRWWQSLLYHPGGFREEFCKLALGRGLAAIAGVLVVGAVFLSGVPGALASDLTWVVGVVYAFVGVAIFHHVAAAKGWGNGPIFAFYVAMLIPHVAVLLAVIAWVDTWLDFRKRFPHDGQRRNGTVV